MIPSLKMLENFTISAVSILGQRTTVSFLNLLTAISCFWQGKEELKSYCRAANSKMLRKKLTSCFQKKFVHLSSIGCKKLKKLDHKTVSAGGY
jgi:hypothetical protein